MSVYYQFKHGVSTLLFLFTTQFIRSLTDCYFHVKLFKKACKISLFGLPFIVNNWITSGDINIVSDCLHPLRNTQRLLWAHLFSNPLVFANAWNFGFRVHYVRKFSWLYFYFIFFLNIYIYESNFSISSSFDFAILAKFAEFAGIDGFTILTLTIYLGISRIILTIIMTCLKIVFTCLKFGLIGYSYNRLFLLFLFCFVFFLLLA